MCQRRNAILKGRAPLAATPLATQPFKRVSVDLVELPPARNRDRYVMTVVDKLTRFVQLVPLPAKDNHTVVDALISNFTTLFGSPDTLISDNGTEFTSEYFREVCNLMGKKTRYTTPYNPASNGMVERCNRVIKDCLAAFCEDSPSTWNSRLDYVPLALNTAFHRSVNNQPLYLLTGRKCTFPIGMTILAKGTQESD
ncbi:reverse transcriptase [Penaeus vannamei]|uniref:Reverse transcriptase n=1 Tax=Penaeus vannamei TaxID=6689 RepID=A0A423T0I3_PENVA|nr:reverse transcriptase [Penaeus vannamei]